MNNEFIKHPLDLSFVIIIGCAGVMVSISEWEISEPSSNFSQVRYIGFQFFLALFLLKWICYTCNDKILLNSFLLLSSTPSLCIEFIKLIHQIFL